MRAAVVAGLELLRKELALPRGQRAGVSRARVPQFTVVHRAAPDGPVKRAYLLLLGVTLLLPSTAPVGVARAPLDQCLGRVVLGPDLGQDLGRDRPSQGP